MCDTNADWRSTDLPTRLASPPCVITFSCCFHQSVTSELNINLDTLKTQLLIKMQNKWHFSETMNIHDKTSPRPFEKYSRLKRPSLI